jgi:hypothetical protein
MGFNLHINNILRMDVPEPLVVGKIYPFAKDNLAILADDIQIWLTKRDWTVVADIQIGSQTREDGKTTGKFMVKYLYKDEEQKTLTDIFKRMYGWE